MRFAVSVIDFTVDNIRSKIRRRRRNLFIVSQTAVDYTFTILLVVRRTVHSEDATVGITVQVFFDTGVDVTFCFVVLWESFTLTILVDLVILTVIKSRPYCVSRTRCVVCGHNLTDFHPWFVIDAI